MLSVPAATEGTAMVPDRAPVLSTDRVLLAEVPPTVTPVTLSEAAQPDPLTIIVVPIEPEVGLKLADAVVVTVKALAKVWAPLAAPVMTMLSVPAATEGTAMVPDRAPVLLTNRVLLAEVPPTVTPVMLSEAAQPDPLTVIIVPTGPEVRLKLADGVVVTVKALAKVWAPLAAPVMTMLSVPVATEGTVMVPDRAPVLSTDRVLLAEVSPTVTPLMLSEAAQPDPLTVIRVLTEPEVGLKMAHGVVTVKALAKV